MNSLNGLPGSSFTQYSLSSRLRISTHFLAAAYHLSVSPFPFLPSPTSITARSSLFHRICTSSPSPLVPSTANRSPGTRHIPSFPLECALIFTLRRAWKASGASERRMDAARKPSMRRVVPPEGGEGDVWEEEEEDVWGEEEEEDVWERRCRVWRPTGSLR